MNDGSEVIALAEPAPTRAPTRLLTTEEALREEAAAIHGTAALETAAAMAGQELNPALNRLNSAALCLSGGGIRSAAFALGVIQALAGHPRGRQGGLPDPDKCLLARFQYLSTVSGGGYIGSWLSAWLARADDFKSVWENLVKRPEGPEREPEPIGWLRSYSNYLTPRLGMASADTWAIVSVYLRNLLVNWLVLLPGICAGILALKLFVVLLIGVSNLDYLLYPRLAMVGIGTVCLIIALRYIARYRPSRQLQRLEARGAGAAERNGDEIPGNDPDVTFFWRSLLWSLLSAIILTQYLGIIDMSDAPFNAFIKEAPDGAREGDRGFVWLVYQYRLVAIVIAGSMLGAAIYALAWIAAWPRWMRRWPHCFAGKLRKREWADLGRWSAAGLLYGALVALGMFYYLQEPFGAILRNPATYIIVGVPWILISQWAADMVFVGLTSYEERFNVDQEWLGRAAGWLLVAAAIWSLGMLVTFAGFLAEGSKSGFNLYSLMGYVLVPIAVLTGLTIAIVGTRSQSRHGLGFKGVLSFVASLATAMAAPLFVGALIFSLSIGLDLLLLGRHLFDPTFRDIIRDLGDNHVFSGWVMTLVKLGGGLFAALLIGWFASRWININLFSLHALYRNRLIRAFLGASYGDRNPDVFTGFDPKDDPPMHTLWPKRNPDETWPSRDPGKWRPFHILNLTLNIVSSKHLAWQERKAASFTVSPLHCGTSIKTGGTTEKPGMAAPGAVEEAKEEPNGAYRSSEHYGGRHGISLGTAMAISGAAANPNMGYHSSPSVTFLMTMFNVRLGWWLGNPGREGEHTFMREGPAFAIAPLIEETFGLTTDTSRYIHVSDGGHFENLGLYEMIRRRCRLIVISDVGRDPSYSFEDLGNAVRRIAIDLGVRIEFHKLESLKRRPPDGSELAPPCEYHAVADVHYREADGEGVEDGLILYIKAGYHGRESAGIRSYAMANLDFPHQSTADQWFSESQFESYRSLGLEIMDTLLKGTADVEPYKDQPSLDNLLRALRTRSTAPQGTTTMQEAGKIAPVRPVREASA